MNVESNQQTGKKAVKPSHTSRYVFRIAITAALAGFIFGFDTVVISGANLPIKHL